MSVKRKRPMSKNKFTEETLEDETNNEMDEKEFINSLSKLQNTDPEFYEFLQENDRKLLDFKVDSDLSDNEENADDSDDENDKLHKPSADLQGDSDESDFEEEDAVIAPNRITLKLINEWQAALQSEKRVELSTLSNIVKAFHAALLRVSEGNENEEGTFKVEGSGVFNSVIQLCVLYLQPAMKKILGLDRTDKNPQKCKRWIKVKGLLKTYFIDLFKLLGGVTSINILTVLLKHLHQMSVFIGCFPALTKVLFKRLAYLWSSSEETVRVLAFLCILRITRNNQQALLDNVLKMMYMTYVKNSKFVSPSTRPGISFMRRSLVEMYSLDVNVSYQHVFLYIRQLAIHLRNAIVLHKKENVQVVYNWQFINSLQLWAELLAATRMKPQLQSLVYPLVMIVTNTIKLIPTPQYYPLRFHCVQILVNLSRDSEIFIPILPFLLEVITSYDFSKKHKKVSMKPLNFSCILRLSKSHLTENGFKDAIIDNVYALLLETLSIYSHSISFPDIVVLCILELKQFLKSCSVANYCRKIRTVVDKIEENIQFVENGRKKISFQLNDAKAIRAWETNLQNTGTPIQTFYDNWKKLNTAQSKKRATKNDDIADKLPTIFKSNKRNNEIVSSQNGQVDLFPSDSENENNEFEEEMSTASPPKKAKKVKKSKKPKEVSDDDDNADENDKGDEIADFNIVDW